MPTLRNSRSRRLLAVAAGAALTFGTLTACSGGASDDEITMWTFLDPSGTSGREQVLHDLIESYEDETGVKVNVEVQQWDTLTQKFLAADAAGNAPDVVWLLLDQLPNVIEQGALADLNSLAFGDLPKDQVEDMRDVYWDAIEGDDGSLPGIVFSENYFGILYRTDILAAAGIDPTQIKTWDDLTAAAKQLTDPSQNRWGLGQAFSESFAEPQIISARLMELQGEMFDDEGNPEWATDDGVKAMDFTTSFVTDSGVTPSDAVRLTSEDLYELLAAGQAAMINGSSVRVPAIQAQAGAENVGFMHYPSEDGAQPAPGVVSGWSVGVWSGSDQAEQASEFVAYLSSPEADAEWMTRAQQPPTYGASTEGSNAEFLKQPENQFLNVVMEGVQDYGWLPPMTAPTAGWREAMNIAVQQVLLGEATPKEALEAAEQRFTANKGGDD